MAPEHSVEDIRTEFKGWLEEFWDPDLTMRDWWARLADSGWAAPTWPEQWYGKSLSAKGAAVVREMLSEASAPGPPAGLGLMLAGPTIIAHGTDDQKRRYVRSILSGEEAWCQLFSEPGAGSDLASLQCRAVQDGDEWVINGQKVWTSGGQLADLGMLLARTNPDAPKHAGVTYFAIDMDQPGVEVRPLREMTGRAMFNEVFFSDARAHRDSIIGGLNEGWAVALTTLANERVALGGGGGAVGGMAGRKGGMLGLRAGDVGGRPARGRTGTAAAMGARGFEMLRRLGEQLGRNGDPIVRQKLAQLYTLDEISRFTQLRARSVLAQGGRPGPEASTGKLQISRITRLSRDLGMEILGPTGMLHGADAPMNGAVQELALFSPAVSIYGGSDEVQHNIIGERVLGLPKEPATDKDVPFRDLKVGTQRSPAS
ncbi:MAG TPA: acyl-CoA dehydrogenase family protein [Acidimicrobiales bacterium]|nr:acyl-CoA dehydrogenase family protein [Acidimicrobiales bacterium]